jgi:threonyl-tRNA synthetase
MKIPYSIIIGDKEVAEKKVTIRKRTGENIGPFTVDEFIEMLQGNIDKKSLEN